jgi:Cof subfamily protein (haloacid dehalogenase superfamily)
MGNKEIKLIISDIDGTILDEQHQIDPNLPTELAKLKERKIPFILASARSPKGMQQISAALGITEYPLACYNGALILANARLNQPISSHEVVHDDVIKIVAEVKEHFPKVAINLYSETTWYVDKLDGWVSKEAAITGEEPQPMDLLSLLESETFPVHKLLLIGSVTDIQEVKDYCEQQDLPESTFYLSKENYLEVTHRDVSKEKALVELADFYKVPLSQTMALGDNYNDLPMLLKAGLGVAMANAPEPIKQQADLVTLSNNESGAAAAIRNSFLKKK